MAGNTAQLADNTFQEYILKTFDFGGLFYLCIYRGGQKYRGGQGWGCPACSLTLNLSTCREWKPGQQFLLQVDSCDWKEKSAFPPFQQGCKYSNHLSNKGHLKCKASILYKPENQQHRLSQPMTGSRATHAREKPLQEKQIGNALEKGQSTLVLPSALRRVMTSQSAGALGHFALKFNGRIEIRVLDGPHQASKMSWVLPLWNLNGCLGLWSKLRCCSPSPQPAWPRWTHCVAPSLRQKCQCERTPGGKQ